MASLTHGFFKKFRGTPTDPAMAPASGSPERLLRRSSGLQEFSRRIAGQEGLHILDLGPTSATNINRFTGSGHSIYNEDVLTSAADSDYMKILEDGSRSIDLEKFLGDNLAYDGRNFDAALCWDIPDYLHESLVKPAVERIRDAMRPGGVLLAFFHTKDAGPEAPYYRYHIVGDDTLELQRGPRLRLQRVFNNRHIENLFKEFSSLKFFLSRDNLREVLAIR
jgi:SAM-dependent methyltransferase